jgi:outer membrane protein TolC
MNELKRTWQGIVSVFLALGSAALAPATAAPPPRADVPYAPPVYREQEISLLDAIRLTLEHNPAIKLQTLDARVQEGVAQEETGQFDATLIGTLAYEFIQEELPHQTKEAEAKRREELREVATELGATADYLDSLRTEFIVAREAFELSGAIDSVEFSTPEDQAQFDVLVTLYENTSPAAQEELKANIVDWLRAREDAATDSRDRTRESELETWEQLEKLGPVPEINQDYMGFVDLKLSKPYRMGAVLSPYAVVYGEGTGYAGKDKSPELGGKGIADFYKTQIGFEIDLPLGRGRGSQSAGAAERAAQSEYAASIALVTHTAATSVRNTALAYWDLVAAQQRLEIYEQSLALHSQLVELTETLIRADELPSTELARARARRGNAQALVDAAERDRSEARVTLATLIGLRVEQLVHAPRAADGFPALPDRETIASLTSEPLLREALHLRRDYEAARYFRESSHVLMRAAEVDVKPQLDLTLNTSYSGLNEDANVGEGIGGTITGKWVGPSARVGLDLLWPLANNQQRGKLVQRTAQDEQNAITTADLERTIKANIVLAVESLRETVQQCLEYSEAVEHYRRSVDSEMERLRLGTATLIDTILTEQRLTDALLALVDSQLAYAQLLAQLRFEAGLLVSEGPDQSFLVGGDALTSLPSR